MKFVTHCSNCDPSLKVFLYKFTILLFINSENKSELFTINKKCTIEQQNMIKWLLKEETRICFKTEKSLWINF